MTRQVLRVTTGLFPDNLGGEAFLDTTLRHAMLSQPVHHNLALCAHILASLIWGVGDTPRYERIPGQTYLSRYDRFLDILSVCPVAIRMIYDSTSTYLIRCEPSVEVDLNHFVGFSAIVPLNAAGWAQYADSDSPPGLDSVPRSGIASPFHSSEHDRRVKGLAFHFVLNIVSITADQAHGKRWLAIEQPGTRARVGLHAVLKQHLSLLSRFYDLPNPVPVVGDAGTLHGKRLGKTFRSMRQGIGEYGKPRFSGVISL